MAVVWLVCLSLPRVCLPRSGSFTDSYSSSSSVRTFSGLSVSHRALLLLFFSAIVKPSGVSHCFCGVSGAGSCSWPRACSTTFGATVIPCSRLWDLFFFIFCGHFLTQRSSRPHLKGSLIHILCGLRSPSFVFTSI